MSGRLVKLPEPTTRLPREKPLPNREKVLTRCAATAGCFFHPSVEPDADSFIQVGEVRCGERYQEAQAQQDGVGRYSGRVEVRPALLPRIPPPSSPALPPERPERQPNSRAPHPPPTRCYPGAATGTTASTTRTTSQSWMPSPGRRLGWRTRSPCRRGTRSSGCRRRRGARSRTSRRARPASPPLPPFPPTPHFALSPSFGRAAVDTRIQSRGARRAYWSWVEENEALLCAPVRFFLRDSPLRRTSPRRAAGCLRR